MLKGYFSLWDAENFALTASYEPRDAFWAAVKSDTDPVSAAGGSPLAQSDTIGLSPDDAVHHALACGELRAAALRADGELVSLPTAAWRRRFTRSDDPKGKLRNPFHEATFNRIIPVTLDASGAVTSWGFPIIARADLGRWLGGQYATMWPDPPERPADWPVTQATHTTAVIALSDTWRRTKVVNAVNSSTELGARPPPPRRAGGRPERDDWPMFDKEMMRRVALDGGSLTMRMFRRDMKDWAARHMDPVPDDRTIERRINDRAPPEVFAPD